MTNLKNLEVKCVTRTPILRYLFNKLFSFLIIYKTQMRRRVSNNYLKD